jgi:predicted site-specific integrase-resolvase
VVTYKDRLARFGTDIIEFLIQQNGGELVVLNARMDTTREEELTDDLLAILHYFSCRAHGLRARKKDKTVPKSGTKTTI